LPTKRCERFSFVPMYRKVEGTHGLVAVLGIGQRNGEIATEADEHFGPPFDDGLHRRHGVVAMLPRRFESKGPFDAIQQRIRRLLGDADGAVALHIGVAAQRADSCAGLAEIATQEQQVRDLLHVRGALRVLGDSHPVADDGGVGLGIRDGNGLQAIRATIRWSPRFPASRCRARSVANASNPLVWATMNSWSSTALRGTRGIIQGNERLHDALERRRVAADFDLVVRRGDRVEPRVVISTGFCGSAKSLQRALPQTD
jgi:hypothetical protein